MAMCLCVPLCCACVLERKGYQNSLMMLSK